VKALSFRRLMAAVLAAASLTIAAPAFAGPATDAVKAKQTQLFELLGKPKSAETTTKIGSIFDEMLDYSALAEASFGPDWSKLTDPQKKEFTDLLKQLVKKAYETNLHKTLAFNIEYLSEAAADGGTTVVKTKAVHKTDKREPPIEIAYKVLKSGTTFKVRDIITEDVSLVDGYKSQFSKLFKDKGFTGVTDKMKEKIAKGG
jgi:phospholipid transport system substrate-binding protein